MSKLCFELPTSLSIHSYKNNSACFGNHDSILWVWDHSDWRGLCPYDLQVNISIIFVRHCDICTVLVVSSMTSAQSVTIVSIHWWWKDVLCYKSSSLAWCATSADSDLNYLTYAYCGYGNTNGDQCAYPFIDSSGNEVNECAGQDTSTPWWLIQALIMLEIINETHTRCATAVYDSGYYYSTKNCNFYDLTATSSAKSYGSGTTVTGETCVPMVNISQKPPVSSTQLFFSCTVAQPIKPAQMTHTG